MPHAAALLTTDRLLLRAPHPGQAEAVVDYRCRNTAHFARWDPPQPPDATVPERVRAGLVDARTAFDGGLALRWWLFEQQAPERVIGTVHLSALMRGPFQNATLGYGIDADAQGQGLMQEALRAVIAAAFGPAIHLHRLQAAVRPENTRSLALLTRLGFAEVGLARDYLFIAGAWRDHRLFALTNEDFEVPAHWRSA